MGMRMGIMGITTDRLIAGRVGFLRGSAGAGLFVVPPYPPNPLSTPAGVERGSLIWFLRADHGTTGVTLPLPVYASTLCLRS